MTATAPTTAAAVQAADLELFRALLVDLRADCVRRRGLALAEQATSVPDPVAVARAVQLRRTTEAIDAALERITDGSYGTCLRCGAAIPSERLQLRPFAAACVACEQQAG